MDLILRDTNLPDGSENIDIGIKKGLIVAIERNLRATAPCEIDAAGFLTSPPFVDCHFHLDAAITLGRPRFNESGTLLEGIRVWEELKSSLTYDDYITRALKYCDWAVGQGLLAIRSHVDITGPNLLGLEALLYVREKVQDYIDLQLVAFPQNGYLRSPFGQTNFTRAIDMGAEVVGGIPHFERTYDKGTESVKLLCKIAADRGLMVDMHCDETDDPSSRHVETLANETIRLGLQGRVTASHVTSMHSMDNYYVSKLIPLLVEADLQIIGNPTANMLLMGRHDTYPKRRGMTRIPELIQAGLNVSLGQDSVMDPWGPLNRGDMLDIAYMAIHAGHMSGRKQMLECFQAITYNPARTMGLEGYGIEIGCKANFVILDCFDVLEAIRLRPPRLYVIKNGRVIAKNEKKITHLMLPERPPITSYSR